MGLVAVSAAAGGLHGLGRVGNRGGRNVDISSAKWNVLRRWATISRRIRGEQYPDLTYAAENAVKAVVNIEAIQQMEMRQRRSYDPFLEFFGIPQDYGYGDGAPAVPRAAGRRFGRDYFGGRLYRYEQSRRGRGLRNSR